MLGEYECCLDDYNSDNKKHQELETKLKKYLAIGGEAGYIYSLYYIEINKIKDTEKMSYLKITNYYDITKKRDGSWSKKSSKYSMYLKPYIFSIIKKNMFSEYCENMKITNV